MKNKKFFNLIACLIATNFVTTTQASNNDIIENHISSKKIEETSSYSNTSKDGEKILLNLSETENLFKNITLKNDLQLSTWQNIKALSKSMGKLIADESVGQLTLETNNIDVILLKSSLPVTF